MLDEDAVLAVLQEAGVSKDAAGQALSEWRRGSLEHGITLPAPMPRSAMDPTAAVARRLPIPSERVADVLDTALSRHLFLRGRRNGLGGEWVPRSGMFADLRRRLDFRGALMLKDVNRIKVDVQPIGLDDSRVTLTADISQLPQPAAGLPGRHPGRRGPRTGNRRPRGELARTGLDRHARSQRSRPAAATGAPRTCSSSSAKAPGSRSTSFSTGWREAINSVASRRHVLRTSQQPAHSAQSRQQPGTRRAHRRHRSKELR